MILLPLLMVDLFLSTGSYLY